VKGLSISIVVVGGGAAGLLASISAAEHGAHVTLLERNNKLGMKMLMSEGERCNITNSGDVDHLVQSFADNGEFLYHAFTSFGSRDILDLLAEEGVLTREEERGRVFPVSDDAQDVVDALERRAKARGVSIRLATRVTDLAKDGDAFHLKLANGEDITADRLIVCSGSTGDGYKWAKKFGHAVISARPDMVALETEEEWPARVQGVTLKRAEVVLYANEKILSRYTEDVLFTHFGLSGPAILNISNQAVDALSEGVGPVRIGIRTDSDLNTDDWEARLQMALREHPRQLLKSLVARWWPVSLAEVLLEVNGLPPEVMANQVTKQHRRQTAELLDEFILILSKAHPTETAMVTTGGVCVDEVDPQTMQSRKTPGLYFAGGILDIDGISSSYNLQGAYSTGFVAGRSAACS
jgi:predicted Rossmann fold flavoprotein